MLFINKSKNPSRTLVFALKLIVFIISIALISKYPKWYGDVEWLHRLSDAALFFLGAHLLISFTALIIISWYKRKNHYSLSSMKYNFTLGINRIASVLNFLFFTIALFFFLNINPLGVLTSISIVAAALALLTKDYITNMINGLIIMFGEKLSIGDYIEVNNHSGKIVDITLLNVILQDDNYGMILIPNMLIYTNIVVNKSKHENRKTIIEFEINPSFNLSFEELENLLKQSIQSYEDKMDRNTFMLKTLTIGPKAIKFRVQFMLFQHNRVLENEIKEVVNKKILEIINHHGS